MELLAVIIALESLKKEGSQVIVTSDSKYVVDAVEKNWLSGWEKKDFRKIKNSDLWIRFLKIVRKHSVKFIWIRGHSGHTENERCDELAVAAANLRDNPEDEGYLPNGDNTSTPILDL
jgi:ribonuclease HI